ncbi:enoyl-CoA hydratase-related protein [Rhodococcus sp. NPDC127530]|uniref:enoyl-CoA hydratase-related protein n=1 Tax=unclassified Rhodococcus (in: high G+C Gram-positive bacteria) TaxID=192944 RepID=UPI0036436709
MTVTVEKRGPISIFTIDRPAKRNAFDAVTTEALDAALNEFEDDDSALVGVLTGGPKFFCAGTDIVASAGTPTKRGGPYGIAGRRLTKPIIAAVEGVAAGGGFEIALSATMIVASTTATFSFPEVGLGLVAECGGLFRGPRALPLNVAREMLLAGARLGAQRAYELGLVNKVVEPEHALEEAVSLAEVIVAQAPIAIRETLHAVEALYAHADKENWVGTTEAKNVVRSSSDSVEGVTAFTEKRAPRWVGR